MMPKQLEAGLRKRRAMKVKPEPKPIAEQLPRIDIAELRIPRDCKTYTLPNVSLRYSFIVGMRLSYQQVEVTHRPLHRGQLGRTQTISLKAIRTGFGHRYCFVCQCGRAVKKLYLRHGRLACRRCVGAIHACQALGKHTRPILQQARAQAFIDAKARKYKKTIDYLSKRFGRDILKPQTSYPPSHRSPAAFLKAWRGTVAPMMPRPSPAAPPLDRARDLDLLDLLDLDQRARPLMNHSFCDRLLRIINLLVFALSRGVTQRVAMLCGAVDLDHESEHLDPARSTAERRARSRTLLISSGFPSMLRDNDSVL